VMLNGPPWAEPRDQLCSTRLQRPGHQRQVDDPRRPRNTLTVPFAIHTRYLMAAAALLGACSANQGSGSSLDGAAGSSNPNQVSSPEDGSTPVVPEAVADSAAPAGDASVGAPALVEGADGAVGEASPAPAGGSQDSASGKDQATDSATPIDASPLPGRGADGSDAQAGCSGLFCEDFESGEIDAAVWDTKTFGGQTVTVQSTTAAHGKYAVQFHANPNLVSYDFIITKSAPAALSGHFFGRAYFFITPNPPAEHMEFFFAGTAGFPNLKYIEVASAGTAWQLTYVDLLVASGQAASSPGTQEKYSGGGTVPVKKWTCLEWEVNDAPDQETVYVDGTEDVSFPSITLNGVGSGLVGGFADFGFGYYAWHPAANPIDIYYDDIVLDTKRVGCLP